MTWLTTVLALLPLLGAAACALSKPGAARQVGLVAAGATLGLGAVVAVLWWRGHDLSQSVAWLPALGSSYDLSLDGVGVAMVALTVFLTPLVLVAEWKVAEGGRRWGAKVYSALILAVESCALFVFMTGDVMVFYLFFEAGLIPMYFLIAGWGQNQAQARSAALKFLLFGLAGGLVLLGAVVGTAALSAQATGGEISLNLARLAELDLGGSTLAKVTLVAFFVAFALKAPMVPAHTWLPAAAAQSTPGGAALMVGVLDKLGTFGMIRFCVALFPGESAWATPAVVVLALVSIFYGALAAIGQQNLMRLVAFTSISHFGFMVLGIFALTTPAMTGSIFYMVNHGLSTGALFLLVGYLAHRRGSAEITAFGGVAKLAPVLAGFTLVAGLAGCALPGTSSFVSEFLVMSGTWPRFHIVAGIAAGGTILAALYILWMYQRVMTGTPTDEVVAQVGEIDWRERLAVAPLLIALLGLGFFPRPALAVIEPASQQITAQAGGQALEPVVDLGGND
ncbi:MAG: NADH-quinone oxidoreductase subunit M [Propionibacteriaceae bacterium]|jgi:NADH-quinone oxidoreductase subunit M|nr:NADH-quinone oxidoreductase subunit M [Propionibacteriaceae bacterium]